MQFFLGREQKRGCSPSKAAETLQTSVSSRISKSLFGCLLKHNHPFFLCPNVVVSFSFLFVFWGTAMGFN